MVYYVHSLSLYSRRYLESEAVYMGVIFLGIVTVSLLWGSWPLVAKTAGQTGYIGALIMSASAVIPASIAAWYSAKPLPAGALIKLIPAGIMMGIGLIVFNLVTSSPKIEISVSLPIINILMMVVAVLGGIIFFSESISIQKILGIAFLALGIYLLRPVS
jgi:drug/metabolite transporter (DMT)-like permease